MKALIYPAVALVFNIIIFNSFPMAGGWRKYRGIINHSGYRPNLTFTYAHSLPTAKKKDYYKIFSTHWDHLNRFDQLFFIHYR